MFRTLASIVSLLFLCVSSSLAIEHVDVCRYCDQHHAHHDDKNAESTPKDRKYAPDRQVDVLRIKIDVTPDFDKQTIAGETTLTFAPISKPVRQLRLDATRLRISAVAGSQKVADYTATDKELTVLFARPIPVGQKTSLTLRYTCEPKQGIYFRTEAMGYPKGDDHLWTQGEPHEARHWFPCFDYPNERASTEVICRVPPAMTVLSNGRVVSETIDPPSGLKVVHWRQEKPHVSYLVCLVAGHFHKLEKSHGDLKLRFFSQPSLAEHAANSFADTDQIMAYFEQEIGVPFPWDKYDQVTIRDFNSGGMENTTLTTLTHRTIFSSATENIYSSRGLDAHETAHQWFGDYVTCEDWSHLWLNEGFATYYTHLYKGHRLGRDELLYGLYRDATNRVLTRSEDPRPIVYREYARAWDQFDFRAYPKGSWVLHMLRSQLGENVYRQAIKRYLEKHALTSVVTADLVAELEDASGKSLDRFFDQWVYHGGCPHLKVTYRWLPEKKLAHVHVKQTHKVTKDILQFHLPTTVRFQGEGYQVDHAIEIDDAQQDFYIPLTAQPNLVRFDPEYTLLANIEFNKPQAMLEEQLTQNEDVIGRILAAHALAKKENQQAVEALAGALKSDYFYGVRIAASEALGKLHTDEAFDALLNALAQTDARVRLRVVQDLGRFYRPEARDKLLTIAASERNPAIAAEAVELLGKFGEPQVVKNVSAALDADSFDDAVALAAVNAIGKLRDVSLRERMLEVLRRRRGEFGGRKYARCLPIVARLWQDAEDRTPALELLQAGLRDPARRVRQAAATALGDLGDSRALPVLTDLADTYNERVAEAAEASIKKINKESPQSPAEVAELRDLVRELRKQQKELQESVDALKGESKAKAG